MTNNKYVFPLRDCESLDRHFIGDKAVLISSLLKNSIPVPDGFVITSNAYEHFLSYNKLQVKIQHLLGALNFDDPISFSHTLSIVKNLLKTSEFSSELTKEIFSNYSRLGSNLFVSISESHVLPNANSVARGIISGESALVDKIKGIWASSFHPNIISHKHKVQQDLFSLKFSIIVQKVIDAESNGVIFTTDPKTHNKSLMLVTAQYGLPGIENKVSDSYIVKKPTHNYSDLYPDATFTIVSKEVEKQEAEYKRVGSELNKTKVKSSNMKTQKISDHDILNLSNLGQKIEDLYYFPQQVDWLAKNGKIFITDIHAIAYSTEKLEKTDSSNTIFDMQQKSRYLQSDLLRPGLLFTGHPVGHGIAIGKIKRIREPRDYENITDEFLLLVNQFENKYLQNMKKAAGILFEENVADKDRKTISSFLGIPVIAGVKKDSFILKDGMVISINGITGEVFKGSIKIEFQLNNEYKKTAAKLFADVSGLDNSAIIPKAVDGIGIVNADFVLNSLHTHPKVLIQNGDRNLLLSKIEEYVSYYCKSVFPKPVYYQTNNYTSSRLRPLNGGGVLEPLEENPLLGFRGALRYLNDQSFFDLELEAIQKLRNSGHTNLHVSLPGIRTIKELRVLLTHLRSYNLVPSHVFHLNLTLEFPSQLFLLPEFIQNGVQGFFINLQALFTYSLALDLENSDILPFINIVDPSIIKILEFMTHECETVGISFGVIVNEQFFSSDIIEKLIYLGVGVIIVPNNLAELAHTMIHESELKLLKKL